MFIPKYYTENSANMKSIIIILFLLSFNSYSQGNNLFTAKDKQKHFTYSAPIGIATLAFTEGKSDFHRALISAGIGFGVNFGYETYQGISGNGEVEALDVVYGTIGAFTGTYITLKLKRLICELPTHARGDGWASRVNAPTNVGNSP